MYPYKSGVDGHYETHKPVELSASKGELHVWVHERVELSEYQVGKHLLTHVYELG